MTPSTDTPTPTELDGSDRERLLAAMRDAVTRDGYADATVADAITGAGLSPAIFDAHFADKHECFLAAVADAQDRLTRSVIDAVRIGDPAEALERALDALIDFAEREPAAARLIMNEMLAGGPLVLDHRDRAIGQTAQAVLEAEHDLAADTVRPDLPAEVVIGATHRLIAHRQRRGEGPPVSMRHDLRGWLDAYAVPVARHRWKDLQPMPDPGLPGSSAPLHAPDPPPPGSSRRAVRANERERIMFATARAALEYGYTASTIADITRIAQVDEQSFREHFDSKQDAYLAITELGYMRTMSATAGGFFTGGSWPDRAWEAGRAFAPFMQRNPMIANVGFVESYAVGEGVVKRMDDLLAAFTIFLQEGQRLRRGGQRPTRLAAEAIAATNFELAYRQTRRREESQIAALVPHAIFITLAPFNGAEKTNIFIDGKLAESSRQPAGNASGRRRVSRRRR
jgi:AcrR family transcriptional regulator